VARLRVAVVRGPNLNPWELANYELLDGVVAFGSRRGAFEGQRLSLPVRRLPSPADAVARLPALGRAAVARFGGNLDHLIGLERAVRGFDIVHTAELSTGYSAQAVRARDRGACRRVVATVWENIPLPAPENVAVARRVRKVAAALDHCVAISDDARLHLELSGVPADRIDVLPMGIDLDRFTPTERDEGDGRLRILSVARLVSEKGVEDLVVALRLLADRGVDAELTCVGTGPLGGRLEAMAHGLGVRLRVLGTVSHEELPALHRESDVLVLASAPRATWREQFGFAVVEAMASGLPVLAGDSGSLDEVVGDPEQLVRPHDAEGLAAALGSLAANPERRRAQGERNRRWAAERYDRRRVAERLRQIYERALAAPPRAPDGSSAAASSRSGTSPAMG
jgi:glycosyltransferase involved in cell wall biosynthesis